MIYPTVDELTQHGKINRYTLVVATAKAARIITDEYCRQRDYAEKIAIGKDGDKNKNIASYIKREYRDEKAVKNAINGLYNGEFRILTPEEAEAKRQREEEARLKAEEEAQALAEKQAAAANEAMEADDEEDVDIAALADMQELADSGEDAED